MMANDIEPSVPWRKARTAIAEALAPALRDIAHGRGVDWDDVADEMEYQLEARGCLNAE
jgi:hypothetical protein